MGSEGSSIHVLPAIPFGLANLKKIYLRPQAPFPEHVRFTLRRAWFILFTRFLLPICICSLVAERKHCSSRSLNMNMICVDLSKIQEWCDEMLCDVLLCDEFLMWCNVLSLFWCNVFLCDVFLCDAVV